jgi:hypothetical protein
MLVDTRTSTSKPRKAGASNHGSTSSAAGAGDGEPSDVERLAKQCRPSAARSRADLKVCTTSNIPRYNPVRECVIRRLRLAFTTALWLAASWSAALAVGPAGQSPVPSPHSSGREACPQSILRHRHERLKLANLTLDTMDPPNGRACRAWEVVRAVERHVPLPDRPRPDAGRINSASWLERTGAPRPPMESGGPLCIA